VSSELIIGNYRLVKMMATGQTSQVYEAVETSSGRHFAMKLLLPEKISDPESRQFLLHEAEVGLKLAHENIIRIVNVNPNPNNPYFVMEFFPAGSLKFRLMRKETEFIKEKVHDILRQAATALAFMNAKGWVHRDVKPDNLLVNASGGVRLIDFAISQRIQKPGLFDWLFKSRKKVQGTRSYMSPEQIRGQALDGRADIYSYGCMCYEIVTGRTPFRGSSSQDLLAKHITEKPASMSSMNREVTKEFDDLVLHMLAKRKEDRPKDFHEVLMKLRNVKVYKPPAMEKGPGPGPR
jgi:serine/threonine protein kinase